MTAIDALLQKGLAHLQRGQLQEAERLFRRIVDVAPRDHRGLYALGTVRLQGGNALAAKQFLERALAARPDHYDSLLNLAAALSSLGDLSASKACYERAVAACGSRPEAHRGLGSLLLRLGDAREAAASFRRATEVAPDAACSWNDLGSALALSGEHAEAEGAFRRAVSLDPGLACAQANLGRLLLASDRAAEAVRLLEQARTLSPAARDTRKSLASAWLKSGEPAKVATELEALAAEDGTDLDVRLTLAKALAETGRIDEALRGLEDVARGAPENGRVQNSLGVLYKKKDDGEAAERHFRKALELDPSLSEAYGNLGGVLVEQDRFEEARELLHRALELNPRFVGAETNLANLLRETGHVDEALERLEQALRWDPKDALAGWQKSLTLLSAGRFAEGWAGYDAWGAASRERQVRSVDGALWEGQPLQGKTLLVHAEQGVGDEVMFASCVPDLLDRGARVLLECDARLGPLLARSFPGATVVGRRRKAQDDLAWVRGLPAYDYQSPIGSLPRYLRSREEDFPRRRSYLQPDPARVEMWRRRFRELGPGPVVGISWRGGAKAVTRRRRSIPLERWAPILGRADTHFVSLQYGDARPEIAAAAQRLGVEVHTWPDFDPGGDLDGLAAAISALDLVVSIDNSTVHLAGALGAPVWALIPRCPDWRWMFGREDTPWYPSVRLIRQKLEDPWDCVLAPLAEDLSALTAGEGKSQPARRAGPGTTEPCSEPPSTADPPTLVRLGRALAEEGRLQEASAALLTALEADPSDGDTGLLLAAVLTGLGRGPEAVEIATLVALRDAGRAAAALVVIGDAYRGMEAYEAAAEAYGEASRRAPGAQEIRLRIEALEKVRQAA